MFRYVKLIAFIFLFLVISGCQTAKGFSKGMKGTAGGVAEVGTGVAKVGSGAISTVAYTTEGAAEDAYTGYNLIFALDDWIKENLW